MLAILVASIALASPIHTLSTASSAAVLVNACSELRPALWQVVPAAGTPTHNPRGDAAMQALSQFLLRPGNTKARISCMRYLRNLSTGVESEDLKTKTASGYVADAAGTLERVLRDDPSPVVRAAAADAMWGSAYPDDGLALLESATHDPSPYVRGESFSNMMWPARADIQRSHDSALYDAAIDAALKSPYPQVVGGALIARASLHGLAADAATRPFAFDRRPLVRESAIDAYDYMQSFNVSAVCFIESRLNDPNPEVRSAVLLRLFRIGDHGALPAIKKLSKTAPTKAERLEAADYVRVFKTQPDVLHANCGGR